MRKRQDKNVAFKNLMNDVERELMESVFSEGTRVPGPSFRTFFDPCDCPRDGALEVSSSSDTALPIPTYGA